MPRSRKYFISANIHQDLFVLKRSVVKQLSENEHKKTRMEMTLTNNLLAIFLKYSLMIGLSLLVVLMVSNLLAINVLQVLMILMMLPIEIEIEIEEIEEKISQIEELVK